MNLDDQSILTQRQAIKKSYERYNDNLSRPIGLYGTDTGLHLFNMVSGGHVPSKITTFAGRAGSLKTATLIPMAKAAGRLDNGRRSEILVGSWEMDSSYLIDRYVCHETGLTMGQLRYPKILSPATQALVMGAYSDAARLPIFYHQHSTDIYKLLPVLEKFVRDTEQTALIGGIKIQPVFALDFIGRIRGASKYNNKTYDIENFLQELKQFANDSGLAVYILAQLLRSADEKDLPDLIDIKDSSTIEDNSDTLIIGHRPHYYGRETFKDPESEAIIPSRDKMVVRIVKAREAAPRDTTLTVNPASFRIWDNSHDFGFPYHTLYSQETFWENELRK